MNKFNFTNHALNRMNERNISQDKIEEIINSGQTFCGKNGRYIIKHFEIVGSIIRNYRIIFSKLDNLVITVYCFEKKFDERFSIRKDKTKSQRKIFQQKKKTLKQIEDDDYFYKELKKFK